LNVDGEFAIAAGANDSTEVVRLIRYKMKFLKHVPDKVKVKHEQNMKRSLEEKRYIEDGAESQDVADALSTLRASMALLKEQAIDGAFSSGCQATQEVMQVCAVCCQVAHDTQLLEEYNVVEGDKTENACEVNNR